MHNLILSHPRETDGFSLGLSGLLHAVDRPPPGWHPATGARPRHEAAGCGEEPAAGRGHRASSGTRPLAAAGAEAAGRKAARRGAGVGPPGKKPHARVPGPWHRAAGPLAMGTGGRGATERKGESGAVAGRGRRRGCRACVRAPGRGRHAEGAGAAGHRARDAGTEPPPWAREGPLTASILAAAGHQTPESGLARGLAVVAGVGRWAREASTGPPLSGAGAACVSQPVPLRARGRRRTGRRLRGLGAALGLPATTVRRSGHRALGPLPHEPCKAQIDFVSSVATVLANSSWLLNLQWRARA